MLGVDKVVGSSLLQKSEAIRLDEAHSLGL